MPEQSLQVYGLFYSSIAGDVNGDNTISVIDTILVMKHIINSNTLSPEQLSVADVDSNGIISVIDVMLIQKYALEIITTP